MSKRGGGFSGAYLVAAVGAAVYYIQRSETFGEGALGLLKALFWPAFVIYRVFENLNM
jgi:hypothetical protein